jgi:hypothetical protein
MDAGFAMSIKILYDCDRRAKVITVRHGSLRKGRFSNLLFRKTQKAKTNVLKVLVFFLGNCGRLQISAVATRYDDGEGSIIARMSDYCMRQFRVGGAAILSESSIVDLVSRNNVLLSSWECLLMNLVWTCSVTEMECERMCCGKSRKFHEVAGKRVSDGWWMASNDNCRHRVFSMLGEPPVGNEDMQGDRVVPSTYTI